MNIHIIVINQSLVSHHDRQGAHGTGKTGKTGKMANNNSLQGKLREFENFAKLKENSGNFNLIFFSIC